jgi:hypothetical protein
MAVSLTKCNPLRIRGGGRDEGERGEVVTYCIIYNDIDINSDSRIDDDRGYTDRKTELLGGRVSQILIIFRTQNCAASHCPMF